ncbi:hypothetical protein EDD86DRAFT_211557 [Gorgonomyces haynaldii]|nr:hypothetical protein EDD86DRAFT_211557 [Gorgonomyces haynaldii]
MDFQNRDGVRFNRGSGISASEANVDRRDRLKRLAMETIDLAKDPYFMKNHLGSFECKLCLTLHTNEGSYLAHTQGKKHQINLQRRAAKESRENMNMQPLPGADNTSKVQIRHIAMKIGRPGYKVTKVRDPVTLQSGLLFQIYYPDIATNVKPKHRFMSSFEQHVEAPSKYFQYILFAGEPYETIAFKIQALEVDMSAEKFWSYWDVDSKTFHLQFFFKATSFKDLPN